MTELTAVQTTKKCPVCQKELVSDLTCCSACETQHHQDCWDYADGCSRYGCTAENRTIIERIEELYTALQILLKGTPHTDGLEKVNTLYSNMKLKLMAPVVVQQYLEVELVHWREHYREQLQSVDPEKIKIDLDSLNTFTETLDIDDCKTDGLVLLDNALDQEKRPLQKEMQQACEYRVKEYRAMKWSMFFPGSLGVLWFLGVFIHLAFFRSGEVASFWRLWIVLCLPVEYCALLGWQYTAEYTESSEWVRDRRERIHKQFNGYRAKLDIINYDKQLLPLPTEVKQLTDNKQPLLTEKEGELCKQQT